MTLTPKRNGYELRLRFGKGERERFLLPLPLTPAGLALAGERATEMEAMAR